MFRFRDECGSMPGPKPFIDFGNRKDLTGFTNTEIAEHLLTAENSIFIAGEAKGIQLVITDGEGPKPSIEEIRDSLK